MPKLAAVLQHDFSKMEPGTHYYDVIRLQIFHALHAVFKQCLADMVLLQCHAALSQRQADSVREVGEPGKCRQTSPGATFARQASIWSIIFLCVFQYKVTV